MRTLHTVPLAHSVGEGLGVRAKKRAPYPPPGKGTTVRHEVFEAGAIFSSASVNQQVRCIALTPFVPLSREAGEGERAAGRTAVRPYPPRPQRGRGAGGEGEKACAPCTQYPSPTAWERGWG